MGRAMRTSGVLASVAAVLGTSAYASGVTTRRPAPGRAPRAATRFRPGTVVPPSVAGPNEVVADVLGLGHQQIVRLNGSRVEVVAPEARGGHVLSIFEAGTSLAWPSCERPFHGQDVLRVVGHPASRVAVVGRRIAVSTVLRSGEPWSDGASSRPGRSMVALYEADGTFVTRRMLEDGVAVTALDGITTDGDAYLAIGLSTNGIRVARADRPGLPDHHTVPADWRHRSPSRDDREIVTAVRFGTADDGLPVLVSGAIARDGTAITATDVGSGRLLWADNHPADAPLSDHPTSIAVGRFGPAGAPTVSVAWSSGRLTLHDAVRGTRPFTVDGDAENAVVGHRFVGGEHGRHYLAVRREADSLVLVPRAHGELQAVRSGGAGELARLVDEVTGHGAGRRRPWSSR